MSYGLLLLRVVIGATIFAHGAQKLFGWFGGHGLRGTANFFGSMGWRMPLLMAFLAGLGEASGLAFAAGFLTPLAALGIAIVMLNAIIVVHWRNGFFNGNGGLEFPLTLATVAIAVAATGPGRFSIDNAIGWADNISGLGWGVGVLAAALVVTTLTLTVFRTRARMQEQPA
ncbi:MAG TPA: DoxX family protein [Gaiellaceae bacterium]|nr:DoxX family protein [Gaiellaceae bacterium]